MKTKDCELFDLSGIYFMIDYDENMKISFNYIKKEKEKELNKERKEKKNMKIHYSYLK